MNEPPEANQLVEHFFRHEYANLVSVLTRAFGLARMDLVEDMVSAAILQAMNTWKQGKVPDNPAAWIHRVARNRILDNLRKEKTHEKSLAFIQMLGHDAENREEKLLDSWLDESALPDSLLRMMFVCCHPSLERKSQIALTLKILCGFSINEVASGLLLQPEAVKKRIQRAKAKLAEQSIEIELPTPETIAERLGVVHEVLYLMFNEGYSTSQGVSPIRDDVCEEAARLCHMLCEHEDIGSSDSKALLALMLFHASRLDARTDSLGNAVLLQDQDRNLWDRNLIQVADRWLIRAVVEQPSKYHFEAVIAQLHCSAPSLNETDWATIVRFYDRLLELHDSPVYKLNRAIAIGQQEFFPEALKCIEELRSSGALVEYYLLDCAEGHVQALSGDISAATDAYLRALESANADHQKQLIRRRLVELSDELPNSKH